MKIRLQTARTAFFVVIAATAMLSSCGKTAKEAKAVATLVVGEVTVTSAGKGPASLNAGDEIRAGDIVTTGRRSMATIQIDTVGIVRIVENSTLKMKTLYAAGRPTELNLDSGTVFSKIIKKSGMKYQVKTPTLVASVRGTQFVVVARGKGDSVMVREGIVAVSTPSEKKAREVTEKKRAAVNEEGRIEIAAQNRLEELILEKYALQPYIDGIEAKKPEEVAKAFKDIGKEEERIDKQIEEIKLSPLDRLRKQGKPLVKLFLKDGSLIIGSIEETTADGVKLNTGESVITIPKADIRRRVPTK